MSNTRIRLILVCLVVSVTSGCAITHHVDQAVLPQSTATAMIQPWPLTVGLYIPPAVRSRVFAQQGWRVPAGEAVAANFRWTLQQMFARVVELDKPPSGPGLPQGLAGVIELSDIAYHYGPSGSLDYEIALYSGKGGRLDGWPVTTPLVLWDVRESSLSGSMFGVGRELAYAMRNVSAQFVVHFADRPTVQAWLMGEGISPAVVRPGFSDEGGAPPAMPRILLVPNMGTWMHTDASRAMTCVGRWLAQANPPFEVVPTDQVRQAFFPWLEPSTAPKTIDDFRRWLAEPAIRNKMRAMGARYLLEFHGGTKTEIPGGGILCGAGYGGGGCLGFAWGSRESSFGASLLDMWREAVPFVASETQRGGVYVPAFILPIPIMASTETTACEELSQRIHGRLMRSGP